MSLYSNWIKMIGSAIYGKDNREPIIKCLRDLAKNGGNDLLLDIQPFIDIIATAKKGEEMRDAIVSALTFLKLNQGSGSGGEVGDFDIVFDKTNNLISPSIIGYGPPNSSVLRADPYIDDEGYVIIPLKKAPDYSSWLLWNPYNFSNLIPENSINAARLELSVGKIFGTEESHGAHFDLNGGILSGSEYPNQSLYSNQSIVITECRYPDLSGLRAFTAGWITPTIGQVPDDMLEEADIKVALWKPLNISVST